MRPFSVMAAAVSVAALAGAAACTKAGPATDEPAEVDSADPLEEQPSPVPPLPLSTVTRPGSTAGAKGSASPRAPAAASREARTDAGTEACGESPFPACPLQAWMKANAAAAMSAQDFAALETAMTTIATFAPPVGEKGAYANWSSISTDGAAAAHAHALDAVKAACRGCHRQYKDKYKQEMRAREI